MHLRTITVLCLLGVGAALATASPVINGAVVNLRVFNDDPNSIVTFNNTWPTVVWLQDTGVSHGTGFANRHNFRLSDNHGVSEAVFLNNDGFAFSSDVVLTGTAKLEGGIQVSPWWSKEVDGSLYINGATGEIAAFGGRLPFYSFTVQQGLTYTKGTVARLGVVYNPHSLSQADPGTIQYSYTIAGTTYTSPVLPFDEGDPNEGHGTWGILDDARVGGYVQVQVDPNNPGNWGAADFVNQVYVPEPAAWLLLGLALLIRRR